MKKTILILLLLLLLMSAASAAELTLKGCTVNGLTAYTAEDGTLLTAVADVPNGTEPAFWTVNGQMVKTSSKTHVLVFTVSGDMTVQCVSRPIDPTPVPTAVPRNVATKQPTPSPTPVPTPTPSPTPAPTEPPTPAPMTVIPGYTPAPPVLRTMPVLDSADVVALNATLSANGSTLIGNAATVLQGGSVTVTAAQEQPVEYWVINGTRFDWAVSSFTVSGMKGNVTAEAVYRRETPATLKKAAGGSKTVNAVGASMRFLNGAGNPQGGAFYTFDFSHDYLNLATNRVEKGGSITLCVTAAAQNVRGWQVNGTFFEVPMASFVVRDAADSLTFEAIAD